MFHKVFYTLLNFSRFLYHLNLSAMKRDKKQLITDIEYEGAASILKPVTYKNGPAFLCLLKQGDTAVSGTEIPLNKLSKIGMKNFNNIYGPLDQKMKSFSI